MLILGPPIKIALRHGRGETGEYGAKIENLVSPPTSEAARTMAQFHAKYGLGQLICHRLFDYRGVIVDIDSEFEGTEDWYENVALSRPPKDRPWYTVLVHESDQTTYVAERNLAPDFDDGPIDNPEIFTHFAGFENGTYFPRRRAN